MNPEAAFLAVVASSIGLFAMAAALHFARSVVRNIYPELRGRPNVLRHPVQAFWRSECLTPAGKEAQRRFLVFGSLALGILPIGAWLLVHSGAFDLLR